MGDPYSPTWPWDPEEIAVIEESAAIRRKIEASSLGAPEAQALRATVSDERAARIVALADALAEAGDDAPVPVAAPDEEGRGDE